VKIKHTDSRDGLVILALKDENGVYEVELTSMDVENLIGALRASREEAIGHPSAGSIGQPGMHRVQYFEVGQTLFFRIFLNDRIYHEYPVGADTTLGVELKAFADRFEARNLAKATHPLRDDPKGRN
jgi:hypothetical protein